MIINNTNITGIYIYDSNAVYEKGDFIVVDDKLYICKGRVSGKDPREVSNRSFYKLYLSDEVASASEVIDYIEKGKSDELGQKLVSAKTLGVLLSRYMSGYSDRGLITNKITADRSIIISDFFNNTTTIPSQSLNPLDVILETASLNNAVFLVDPAVVNSLSLVDSSSNNSSINVNGEVVLRQYTYKSGEVTTRVQELIDHRTASILYRYSNADINTHSFSALNTTWNTSLASTRQNIQSLNLVRNYYLDLCNKVLVNEVDSLEDFIYRGVKVRSGYDTDGDKLIVPISMYQYFNLSILSSTEDWQGTLVFSLGNNNYDVEEIPFLIPASIMSGQVSTEFTIGVLNCGSTVTARSMGGSRGIVIYAYNTSGQLKKVTGLSEIVVRNKRSFGLNNVIKGNMVGNPVTDNPLRSTTGSIANLDSYEIRVKASPGSGYSNEQFLITINPECQLMRDEQLITDTKRYSVTLLADDIIKNQHMSYLVNDVNIFDKWSKSEIESVLGINDLTGINLSQVYKIAIENVVVTNNLLDSFNVKVTHYNSLDKKPLPFYVKVVGNIPLNIDWLRASVNIL